MYEQISQNKRNSWLLVVAIALFLGLLGYILGEYWAGGYGYGGVVLALVIALVSGLTSYYGGAGMILAMSRARRIEKKDNPRLFNVIEELSIAAGIPMPAVYIIEDSAPNAFATGRDPEHAAVAITTGLLEKLSRDELQGVMAHELSHVQNRDILFAMMVGIMVGSIVLVSDFFVRSVIWGRGGRRKGNDRGSGPLILVGIVLAILAPLFAKVTLSEP